MFDSSQTPYQGILHSTTPSATCAIPVQVSTGRPVARGEERIGSTATLPMSERMPSTMISFYQRKYHRILWMDSKDNRYRSFSSTNSPLHHYFSYWKMKFKTQVSPCSDFPSEELCYGSKKWRWSIRWMNENPRDHLQLRISRISSCWTRRLLLL